MGLTDALSYLDEVQECLDTAGLSETSCIEGIKKADLAVKKCRGDVEVLCNILMKRAQLLFTAVRKTHAHTRKALGIH